MSEHEKVCQELTSLYDAKNQDYGNSFDDAIDEWGLVSAAIRIGDKQKRLNSILRSGIVKVKSESVRDTLLDLANYAIMTVMYMDRNKINAT